MATIFKFNALTGLLDLVSDDASLVSTDGTGSAGEVALWTDANTVAGDAALTFIAALLNVAGKVAIGNVGNATDTLTVARESGQVVLSVDTTNSRVIVRDFYPASDNSHDIGSGALRFARLFAAGVIQTATQLESQVVTGTAPLIVASTTLVANLNADLLDGLDATAFVLDAEMTAAIAAAVVGFVTGSGVPGELVVWAGPTSLGTNGTAYQPFDFDTTAIAALTGTGIAVRTAANTWAQRTIASANGMLTVADAGGVAGDPTLTVVASAIATALQALTNPIPQYALDADVTTEIAAAIAGFVTGAGAAGRVAYWTGAAAIDDDVNFTWDSAGQFLGLGVGDAAPGAGITIYGSTQAKATITMTASVAGVAGPRLQFRASRGTPTVPTGLSSGDLMMTFQARGFDNIATYQSCAQIRVLTTEAYTSTSTRGCYMDFQVNANSAPGLVTVLKLDQNADVLSQVSKAGVTRLISLTNTSNSASAQTQLDTGVAGTSAGDPFHTFTVTSGSSWAIGVDNSDSDQFKISLGAALGTGDALTITTAGVLTVVTSLNTPTLRGGTSVGGNLSILTTSDGSKGRIFFGSGATYGGAYNETNGFWGMGIQGPSHNLDIRSDAGTSLGVYSFVGSNAGAQITIAKGRGTRALPTAALSGDLVFQLLARAQYDSVSGNLGQCGAITFTLRENASATARGSKLEFSVVRPTTATEDTLMRLYNQGVAIPGTFDATCPLDVVGKIQTTTQFQSLVATGTAPLVVASTTLVANLNADLLDGLSSAAFQLIDADLTAIAALTGTGYAHRTAADTWALDTPSGAFEMPGDNVPGSPNALDDEFNAASLSGLWAWVNQGGASVTASTNGYLLLNIPSQASDDVHMLVQTAPATPWTVICRLDVASPLSNYAVGGLCFRNSSNSKLLLFGPGYNASGGSTGGVLTAERWTSETSWNASIKTANIPLGVARYLKATSDGTTITFSYSTDGVAFHAFIAETIATHVGTIHQIGIMGNESGSLGAFSTAFYWFRVS